MTLDLFEPPQALSFQSNVVVNLAFINPDNGKDVNGTMYLCRYSGTYAACQSRAVTFGKQSTSWRSVAVTFGPPAAAPAGSRIAIYLVHTGGPQGNLPVWLLYDSNVQPEARGLVTFTGQWGP